MQNMRKNVWATGFGYAVEPGIVGTVRTLIPLERINKVLNTRRMHNESDIVSVRFERREKFHMDTRVLV